MFRSERTTRSFIAIISALLLGCCAGAAIIYSTTGRSIYAKGRMPTITIAWEIPATGAQSLTLSRDGDSACILSREGKLSCYRTARKAVALISIPAPEKCYSVAVPGADRVVVAPGGQWAVVYSALNPLNDQLTILDSTGSTYYSLDVSGAVWCADVCSSPKGARFVVGTGEKYVYVIDVDRKRKRYKRWRSDGAVTSVNVSEDGDRVLVGAWQDSGVMCVQSSGRRVWQDDTDSASLQFADILDSPDRTLVRAVPNRNGADGAFAVLNASGTPIWQCALEAGKGARVLTAPNGLYTCVGYDELIRHKKKSMHRKRVVLYDGSGRMIWDKGSLLLEADPLLVTNKGYVVVVSHGTSLFGIGPAGDPQSSIKLPAAIKSSVISRNGSAALVECANGKIYMLNIAQ